MPCGIKKVPIEHSTSEDSITKMMISVKPPEWGGGGGKLKIWVKKKKKTMLKIWEN